MLSCSPWPPTLPWLEVTGVRDHQEDGQHGTLLHEVLALAIPLEHFVLTADNGQANQRQHGGGENNAHS